MILYGWVPTSMIPELFLKRSIPFLLREARALRSSCSFTWGKIPWAQKNILSRIGH